MKCVHCGKDPTGSRSGGQLIEYMLEEVEADLEDKGRANDFIASLREFFTEHGSLSPKQISALTKFYENI